jgi:DNA primase catalytic core
MPIGLSDRDLIVEELARRADLPAIAEELGMRVLARGSKQPKALCPFHDDRSPSLVFYSGEGAKRGRFHCFGCGAHGDAYGLIMKLRHCDFRGALEWLSAKMQLPLPQLDRQRTIPPRYLGLQFAYEVFSRQSRSEANRLKDFATERGFETEKLLEMEVFAMEPPKLSTQAEERSRETIENLLAAGLIRRLQLSPSSGGALPTDLPPRDFFFQPRIVFTLREDRGRLVGFAGRALIPGDEPKYLYSPGFPRSDTLYRLDRVRSTLRAQSSNKPQRMDVFLVEGLLDALRFESLGLNAVAIFGTQLTPAQAQLFAQLASDLDRDNCQLVVHLFLDADEPGRHALRTVLPRLLEIGASGDATGFLLDVVLPPLTEKKNDPDALLRTCKTQRQALALLAQCTYSVIEAFLADALPCDPTDLAEKCGKLPESYRVRAYREIERHLKPEIWHRVVERLEVFARHLDSSTTPIDLTTRREIESFLLSRPLALPLHTIASGASRNELNQLQRAMHVALASGQRKELPVDEGSWERMDAAVEISIPFLADNLGAGIHNTEPMIATLVPKPPQDFRPKALPCAEKLTMQQYLLNELLRDHAQAPEFSQAIPAIRYSSGRNGGRPWMTGGPREQRLSEAVSFAYQVDMDVVEGRVAPRREGMFRPYYRCWREFINFIDRRAAACRVPLLYVARLDIRRFYDTIGRSIIIDALLPGLCDALSALADTAQPKPSAKACAPLFVPSMEDPEKRAQRIVDWLCDESFNYIIENPKTGEPEQQRHGIPQGPDLSAYLANVALFRLDYELQKIVREFDDQARAEHQHNGKRKQGTLPLLHLDEQTHEDHGGNIDNRGFRGGVYARYVDDIVLVARTPNDLSRMRSSVERQLTALGLTLSPKTEPLPPMDATSFREWLTSERGAALGASGIFAGPPSTDSFNILDPLVDAGDIERGDSLQILYSPRLENPITTAAEVIAAIRTARLAHDLRHGDRAKAAQHVWRCVLKPDDGPKPTSPEEATKTFMEIWDKTGSQLSFLGGHGQGPDQRPTADLLSWLEGIDRLLGSRRDRDPSFSSAEHQEILGMREAIARLVCDGLCPAITAVFDESTAAKHEHMLGLRCMAILRAAILVVPNGKVPNWFISEQAKHPPHTLGQKRLIISIAVAGNEIGLLNRAAQQDVREDWLLLHEGTARLQLAAVKQASDMSTLSGASLEPHLDPLAPLLERLQPVQKFRDLMASDIFFYQTLGFLLPNFEGFSPADSENGRRAARAVARMLSGLAPQHLQELLQHRRSLTQAILSSGDAHWRGNAVATPPGVGVPGLVGVEEDSTGGAHRVVRVDFNAGNSIPFCPSDLEWTQGQGLGDNMLQLYSASLGTRRLLRPNQEGDPLPSTVLPWLAEAFTALAGSQKRDGERVCAATAVNLIGRGVDEEPNNATWHVIGYEVEESRLRGQAFIRRGNGLMLEPVANWQDHLWRAGTALADFLGRLDVSRSIPSLRIAAKANIVGPGSDWAVEAMLRFSLTRLRGWVYPSNSALPAATRFPKSIERLLARLRTFPVKIENDENGQNERIAHLVATLSEGRALHMRSECDFDFTLPGGAAALLADLVRRLFSGDEELASRLPRHQPPWPDWTPKRRPARAWLGLALRLDALTRNDSQTNDPTLSTIAAGARLLSIEAQIRAQALELWAMLDDSDRERIRRDPIFGGDKPLDGTSLLHRDQETDLAYAGPGLNLRFLMDTISEATARNTGARFHVLDGITPLGWSVLLVTLITEAMRKRPSGALLATRTAIESVAFDLMVSTDADGEAPWDDLTPMASNLRAERTSNVFAATKNLDQAMGIVVDSCRSELFNLRSDPRTGLVQVETNSGSYQFPSWRIDYAGLRGEPHRGVEQTLVGERYVFHWSQSVVDNRLIDIGVVKPHLASLSDLKSSESSGSEPENKFEGELLFASEFKPVPTVSPPNPAPIGTGAGTNPRDLPPSPPSPEAKDQEQRGIAATSSTSNPVETIQRLQEKSWASRPEKAPRHARVAVFQWDLDETYRHPLFDACLREFPKNACLDSSKTKVKYPEKWNEPGELPSCREHRRRALLRAVLRACRAFKVDILLLPEYSIRPETAKWLREELRVLAPLTSIWAGTYRQPPNMRLKVAPDEEQPPAWSAVMPIILAPAPNELDWRVRLRLKKYPAVAMNEMFCPKTTSLEPEFKATSAKFDPRAYVNELICSEVFLVTSPANLLGMVHAFQRLLFNFSEGPQRTSKELESHITEDIRFFAHYTSLSHALDQPRLLLLVPAMTTRSVDYSILGQASFLASAVTTVFCNAVAGRFGCGESCIIGHDGWGKEAAEAAGAPGLGPYHGAMPGIYHPDHFQSGRLGKREQALVIVDIDPIYSPEGKPRPQMLPPPLSLVAHLPVIESFNPENGKEGCPCQRWQRSSRIRDFGIFANKLLGAISTIRGNTSQDTSPEKLANLLEQLELFVLTTGKPDSEQSGWLKERRTAYQREHANSPRSWPPPVALDWLFADLPEGQASFPKLEVPAYSLAPGEKASVESGMGIF